VGKGSDSQIGQGFEENEERIGGRRAANNGNLGRDFYRRHHLCQLHSFHPRGTWSLEGGQKLSKKRGGESRGKKEERKLRRENSTPAKRSRGDTVK